MKLEQFSILMNALFSNNQLFIPQGTTLDDWIVTTFNNLTK